MTSRITTTLVICTLAAGGAAFALARPATTPEVQAASANVAEAPAPADTAPANTGGYGNNGSAAPQAADAPAEAPAATGSLTIEGFDFTVDGTFQAGQTISVPNLDGAPHTATANDGSFDTGTIDGGATGQLTLPSAPGTYEFFCAIHPSMTGTITVS